MVNLFLKNILGILYLFFKNIFYIFNVLFKLYLIFESY